MDAIHWIDPHAAVSGTRKGCKSTQLYLLVRVWISHQFFVLANVGAYFGILNEEHKGIEDSWCSRMRYNQHKRTAREQGVWLHHGGIYMEFPQSVELIDVGPRDGLQNEPIPISLTQKKELILRLAQAGYKRIETASFVHPKWVPQMADAEAVAEYCNELGLTYLALTPNERGLERAMAAQVPQVAVFIGASSPFNQKNINRTTDEALHEVASVFAKAKANGVFVRGYVSTAFSCPYQGKVSFPEVQHVVDRFVQLGADEIDIGDTDGHANPRGVYERFARLQELYPQTVFVAHFHDTWKMALANTLAALQAGIRKFDGSVGGLGGCPYSPGASGNVATEDLVRMFTEMGVDTGLSLPAVKEAAQFATSLSSRLNTCSANGG